MEAMRMGFKLEQLEYQKNAVNSVVSIFNGQQRNTFDNACHEGIRTNFCSLSPDEVQKNIKAIIQTNGISDDVAKLSDNIKEVCIEMETGTGKTLVYLKTIYELYKHYSFTKFIIIVPSVAIKEGVLSTFDTFKEQLEEIYNVEPHCFEYDSKRLSEVMNFIEEQHPQIMVMTLQSFNSDDRILNQAQREDLFSNMPYIDAIAKTNPIVIMDEPQEGMDTGNSIERLNSINPLVKLRYSATHKVMNNLVYRLTPFDSYKQGLVKKIEVLTVSEKNDEATMKIELESIVLDKKSNPLVVLRAWTQTSSGFKFKSTKKLGVKSDLFIETNNVIYKGYEIERIEQPLRGKGYVRFTNGAMVYEGDKDFDYKSIFNEQLYWLIDTHFRKRARLQKQGIKCLSLVFIDRVNNYVQPEGVIKLAFEEQFKKVYFEQFKKEPTTDLITKCQGSYFAKNGKGEYIDSEGGLKEQKSMYDIILKNKEELLSMDCPIEFVFSHSALGVGWDNPNVFNIATLNQSYSEIKKRQEIGRGLRICVNNDGQRVYDSATTEEGEEVNLLTVIPNDTYEAFVNQYQAEIIETYGNSEAGAETRNTHKGEKPNKKTIKRNDKNFESDSFRQFWKKLSQKTDYLVSFDESRVITESINAINQITISEHKILLEMNQIKSISQDGITSGEKRSQLVKAKAFYSSIDLVEEISENTSLAYPTVFKIIGGISNKNEILKNPPRFLQEAIQKIRGVELEEMVRGIRYNTTGEVFADDFKAIIEKDTDRIQATPNRGIYDHIVWDSEIERDFSIEADSESEVVCFLKLPPFYFIKTPAGPYYPDFGVVLKNKKLRDESLSEYYFVIETKGTNDIDDKKSLTENEAIKIRCAMEHFKALGIDARVHYSAPIKDFMSFKKNAMEEIK
jgi:type III restriction enzyme